MGILNPWMALKAMLDDVRSQRVLYKEGTQMNKEKSENAVAIREHLSLLGFKVKDRVTGFEGVVTSVGFDLFGCIQAIVNPGMGGDGKLGDSQWFDVNRLEKTASQVMNPPNFDYGPIAEGRHGPAEKPAFFKV